MTSSIVFLTAFEDSQQSTFSTSAFSKKKEPDLKLDSLLLCLSDHEFNNKASDSFRYSQYEHVSPDLRCKVAYGFERLEHVSFFQSDRPPIVLYTDSVVSLTRAFFDSELHLCGKMVKSVFSRVDQLQFVLDVAFVVFFLKRLDYLCVFFLLELLVHVVDILFEKLLVLLVGLPI